MKIFQSENRKILTTNRLFNDLLSTFSARNSNNKSPKSFLLIDFTCIVHGKKSGDEQWHFPNL